MKKLKFVFSIFAVILGLICTKVSGATENRTSKESFVVVTDDRYFCASSALCSNDAPVLCLTASGHQLYETNGIFCYDFAFGHTLP